MRRPISSLLFLLLSLSILLLLLLFHNCYADQYHQHQHHHQKYLFSQSSKEIFFSLPFIIFCFLNKVNNFPRFVLHFWLFHCLGFILLSIVIRASLLRKLYLLCHPPFLLIAPFNSWNISSFLSS